MQISNSLIEAIIKKNTFEFNGCHNPGCGDQLWGRAAYWRVYIPGSGFHCKITTKVNSLNPRPKTLDKLLREELRKRINMIQEWCETDHYGNIRISYYDPCSVKPLVEAIEGEYIDTLMTKRESA